MNFNPNRVDEDGKTLLFYAFQLSINEEIEAFDFLTEMNKNKIAHKTSLAIHLLQQYDVDVNGDRGGELLLLAAQNGFDFPVELLLNKGVDVNYQDPRSQKTALHLAVESKRLQVALLLNKKKIDLTLKDSRGKTAQDICEDLIESYDGNGSYLVRVPADLEELHRIFVPQGRGATPASHIFSLSSGRFSEGDDSSGCFNNDFMKTCCFLAAFITCYLLYQKYCAQ